MKSRSHLDTPFFKNISQATEFENGVTSQVADGYMVIQFEYLVPNRIIFGP